ncbi:MAG TPA: serine/threonine-protein kinase, partial [Thermoanaerobaculia bacterium]
MQDPDDPTDVATAYRPASESRSRRDPRFTPGTMLGDRYRIVSLLGSGGMGEVYRADDTKLGQPVALKFLPHTASDPVHVERLHDEVRLGRQVSHPNVCRLYDIGEWEGNHFLAMEYVDGEDLSSLLRRIGGLPHDKAIEIAREICAGIAAAHSLNIIHRDLKPANIMIDGRGRARITDFGLAVVAEELAARNEIAGTPAYMAPEQLAGGTVTHKSDLYALGLILHEIFTGKKLFEGAKTTDLSSRRSAIQSLTSGDSRGVDPAIQRVISRCLEENPEARPSSIHAVIAAMPGGDPLQAAIDAGETPSPQMIAAAGEVGELSPPVAWSVLVLSLLSLAGVLMLFPRTMLFRLVTLEKSPEALVEQARTVIAAAGLPRTARDDSYVLDTNDDFFAAAIKSSSPTRWENLDQQRPGVFLFHYRQSPAALVPSNQEGRVTAHDPPLTIAGMTHVTLDMSGRLTSFTAVPAPSQAAADAGAHLDWAPFFEFAGGDLERLTPVPSLWPAPVGADATYAWEGVFRDQPSIPIRVEAASHQSSPVWFKIFPLSTPPSKLPSDDPRGSVIFNLVTAAVLVAGVILARRNLRRGRGDRRTATRLAFVVFIVGAAAHLLRADHVASAAAERLIIERGLAWSLYRAAEVWVLYLALEPFVRRRWPHTLISWTRLFAGRLRDPMIGRDLLIGTGAGLLLQTLFMGGALLPTLFGQPALA